MQIPKKKMTRPDITPGDSVLLGVQEPGGRHTAVSSRARGQLPTGTPEPLRF